MSDDIVVLLPGPVMCTWQPASTREHNDANMMCTLFKKKDAKVILGLYLKFIVNWSKNDHTIFLRLY